MVRVKIKLNREEGVTMHPGQKAVVWFNGVTKKDVATVGGKGANLGEMTKARIPVPPGSVKVDYFWYIFSLGITLGALAGSSGIPHPVA